MNAQKTTWKTLFVLLIGVPLASILFAWLWFQLWQWHDFFGPIWPFWSAAKDVRGYEDYSDYVIFDMVLHCGVLLLAMLTCIWLVKKNKL